MLTDSRARARLKQELEVERGQFFPGLGCHHLESRVRTGPRPLRERASTHFFYLGLDLVEVAPNAVPPVCRLLEYGKYKYEQSVRQREARKKQTRTVIKEVKFRPKIDDHDFEVKRRRVVEFLDEGGAVTWEEPAGAIAEGSLDTAALPVTGPAGWRRVSGSRCGA